MKTMKSTRVYLLTFLMVLLAVSFAAGQEEEVKEIERPVRSPYEAVMLVDFPTTKTPAKGAFELYIHHRFGLMENGFSDIFGIYGTSNVNLGINYGVTRRLSVGFGTVRYNQMQNFNAAYRILEQTRSGKIPVSVMLYGNFTIDARNKSVFGQEYAFANRISYFSQLIVGRKFSSALTLHAGASFSHFNAVDSLLEHDKVAVHVGGRLKLWNSNSFVFEYTQPLDLPNFAEHVELTNPPKPGLSLGLEFGTSTHAFQVFVTNYEDIIPQQNVSFNQYDFFGGDILLGFNITVRL